MVPRLQRLRLESLGPSYNRRIAIASLRTPATIHVVAGVFSLARYSMLDFEFWSIGTQLKNAIPHSKIHPFCRAWVAGHSANHVDIVKRLVQNAPNLRYCRKFQNSRPGGCTFPTRVRTSKATIRRLNGAQRPLANSCSRFANRFVFDCQRSTHRDDRGRRIFNRWPHAQRRKWPRRLRVVSVHARFYQIVDDCQVSVFGQGEGFTTEFTEENHLTADGRR